MARKAELDRAGYDSQAASSRYDSRAHRLRRWLWNVLRSFGFAFVGIGVMVRTQRNAQIHLAITVAVIVAALVFRVSWIEWLVLLGLITLVLALEAVNTAIEALVDLASPQTHPLAKRAKDVSAGAVLIGAIGAALVGLLIFVPRLLALLA